MKWTSIRRAIERRTGHDERESRDDWWATSSCHHEALQGSGKRLLNSGICCDEICYYDKVLQIHMIYMIPSSSKER